MMGMKEEGSGGEGMFLGRMLMFAALPQAVNQGTVARKVGRRMEVRLRWFCAGKEKIRY